MPIGAAVLPIGVAGTCAYKAADIAREGCLWGVDSGVGLV